MKSLNYIFTLILLIIINTSYGQFAKLFVKLFMENDKKIISIVEKDGLKFKNKFKNEIKVNDYRAYDIVAEDITLNKNKYLPYSEYIKLIDHEVSTNRISQFEANQLKLEAEIKSLATVYPHHISNGKLEKELLKEQNEREALFERKPNPSPPHKPTPLSLKKIDKAKVFVSIPSNDMEFKNMFKSFNKNQSKDVIRLKGMLEKENNKNVNFPSSREMLFEMLTKNDEKEKPFIIIGHNEEGLMCFPDGSESKLKDIDSVAKKFSRIVVYLSCNASEYTKNPAASYFLTYHEAVRLTNRLNSKIKTPLKLTPEQCRISLQKKLDDYGKEKQLKFRLKVVKYTVSASVIGYGIYEIRSEKK